MPQVLPVVRWQPIVRLFHQRFEPTDVRQLRHAVVPPPRVRGRAGRHAVPPSAWESWLFDRRGWHGAMVLVPYQAPVEQSRLCLRQTREGVQGDRWPTYLLIR